MRSRLRGQYECSFKLLSKVAGACYQRNMADTPENRVLAQLRAIRADLADVQGTLGEIKGRLTNVEGSLASVIQHLGHLAAADAQQQVAADRITERLVRIERRLDLREV